MPGKHNAGGCGCCGCWDCGTSPETVAITPDTYAGACCQYPSGTLTVGAANGGGLLSDNGYSWDDENHVLTNDEGNECSWTWRYVASQGSNCRISSPYGFSGGVFGGGGYTYVEKCEENDLLDSGSNVIGEYWVVEQVRVHVTTYKSPRRVTVIIYRLYEGLVCSQASGLTPDAVFTMEVYDEYTASSVDCASLPATINHTARYSTWTQHETGATGTTDSVDYGYNPADSSAYDLYNFTACAANASVDLTYA